MSSVPVDPSEKLTANFHAPKYRADNKLIIMISPLNSFERHSPAVLLGEESRNDSSSALYGTTTSIPGCRFRIAAARTSDRILDTVTPITNDGQMPTSLDWVFSR